MSNPQQLRNAGPPKPGRGVLVFILGMLATGGAFVWYQNPDVLAPSVEFIEEPDVSGDTAAIATTASASVSASVADLAEADNADKLLAPDLEIAGEAPAVSLADALADADAQKTASIEEVQATGEGVADALVEAADAVANVAETGVADSAETSELAGVDAPVDAETAETLPTPEAGEAGEAAEAVEVAAAEQVIDEGDAETTAVSEPAPLAQAGPDQTQEQLAVNMAPEDTLGDPSDAATPSAPSDVLPEEPGAAAAAPSEVVEPIVDAVVENTTEPAVAVAPEPASTPSSDEPAVETLADTSDPTTEATPQGAETNLAALPEEVAQDTASAAEELAAEPEALTAAETSGSEETGFADDQLPAIATRLAGSPEAEDTNPTTAPSEATEVAAAPWQVAPDPTPNLSSRVNLSASADSNPSETVTPNQTPQPTADATAPTFDIIRIDAAGSGLIAGRAAPNSTVRIMIGTEEIATVEASSSGEFVAFIQTPAADEGQRLSLLAQNGAEAAVGREGVLVLPAVDDAGAQIEPTLVKTDPEAVRIIQPSALGKVAGVTLDTISYDEAGEVRVSGRAPGPQDIRIYVDGAPVGIAEATDAGTWDAQLTQIKEGRYVLRVDALKSDGTVSSRAESPFQRVYPTAEQRANPTQITVQPGNSLWVLAEDRYGQGLLYTQIFSANREAIRDPDLIYPGQIFTLPEEAEFIR